MPLTPEQFNKTALKEDLKEFAKSDEIQKMKDEILASNDKLIKKLDNIEFSFISNQAAHDRMQERIEGIEKHIKFKPSFEF